MSDLLFSLNVTMPIFLVMVLGYFLRRIGMLDEGFVKVCNRFNFKVTLPFLVFKDLAAADLSSSFDLLFVFFCAGATLICFLTVWCVSKYLLKKPLRGAFVQASCRSSAAVLGLAFIQNIYGSASMGSMMIIGAVPLYNILSVLVLTFEGEGNENGSHRIRSALRNIITNPIIIAIILGCLSAVLHITYPVMISKTISSVSAMATPLALVALGAGFEGRKAIAKVKPTLAASAIKLVLQAGVFVPAAVMLGFRGEKLIAILIMLAAPATPTCYVMAQSMKNDEVLTASIVVSTTVIAAFTLTGWIWLLKSTGLI